MGRGLGILLALLVVFTAPASAECYRGVVGDVTLTVCIVENQGSQLTLSVDAVGQALEGYEAQRLLGFPRQYVAHVAPDGHFEIFHGGVRHYVNMRLDGGAMTGVFMDNESGQTYSVNLARTG